MIELIEKLKISGYDIKGLNDIEISNIEDYFNVSLPQNYKEFLRFIGKSGGEFLRGEDCFYDRIYELREYAEDLLKEDESDFELKKEYFIFYCHQGYIFAYFDTLKGNESPVYLYREGNLKPENYSENFLSFLNEKYEEHLKFNSSSPQLS